MTSSAISIPPGKLAAQNNEDDAACRRRELREALLRGDEVVVTQGGQVKERTEKAETEKAIVVPPGKLAAQNNTEDDAARRRRELREALLRGDEVVVTQAGQVKERTEKAETEKAIVVPPGKLADDFYWYERNPKLLQDEIAVMKEFFPEFRMEKLADKRVSWVGKLQPVNIRKNSLWLLQLIYDHNHPNNSSWGGSVKVYSVDPNLGEWTERMKQSIPHTLTDSANQLYLCTARKEDVKVGAVSTSAASSLAWAAKWIAVCELWLAGEVSTPEFQGHTF